MHRFQPSRYSNDSEEHYGWLFSPVTGAASTIYTWYTSEDEAPADPSGTAPTTTSPVPSGSPPAPAAQGAPYPDSTGKTPLTKRPWFWPTVIIGSALIVGGAITFWPRAEPKV